MTEEKANFYLQLMVNPDMGAEISQNMKEYGGSFVKALSECIIHADAHNLLKLVNGFYPLFVQYSYKNPKMPMATESAGFDLDTLEMSQN